MTPEQRYRLELAKDRTPGTNPFLWFVPLFVIIAMLTKAAPDGTITIEVPEYRPAKARSYADWSKYPDNDPVCGGKSLCFLGWELL